MKLFGLVIILFSLNTSAKNIGVEITEPNQFFQAYLGYRLQASSSFSNEISDISLRRLRLNLLLKFKNKSYFYADIRNDKINNATSDNNDFVIGDAYYQYRLNENNFLRFFRAKVDISRSQTSSSAHLAFYNRSYISDFASNFIISSRRAANLQLNGKVNWLSYQLALSDSLSSDALEETSGASLNISSKKLAYGGKIRLHPFKNWTQKSVKEVDHTTSQFLSLGAGYFYTSSLTFQFLSEQYQINRSLLNLEFSLKFSGFSLQLEYFRFQGTINNFSGPQLNIGKSDGYHVLAQYQIPNTLFSIFSRYEVWDQAESPTNIIQKSYIYGLNYYLKGNKIRFGIAYQKDSQTSSLESNYMYHLYTMLNY